MVLHALCLGSLVSLLTACNRPAALPQTGAAQAAPAPPERRLVDRGNWRDWFMHVYPVRDELSWQDYGWKQRFGEGLLAAQSAVKPAVVWLETGHPLGSSSPAGRRLQAAWIDAQVTAAMKEVVPVADDLRRLLSATDAEASFAQGLMAEAGLHEGGVLVLTPGGKLLASCTDKVEASRLAKTLQDGLKAWAEQEHEEAALMPEQLAAVGRAEDRFPEHGLALEVFLRDLPLPTGEGQASPQTPASPTWSRDYLWFSRAEMKAMLPEGGSRLSQRATIPQALATRLARLALHDHLYADGTPYAAEDVVAASLELQAQSSTPTHRSFRLRGHATLQHGEGDAGYGIEVELIGKAQWDKQAEEFSLMEIVGEGIRHGQEPGSGRPPEAKDTPRPHLGFALRRVKSVDGWHRVPPRSFDQYPDGWGVEEEDAASKD